MKTELVVITGMSGSGKSVALHALEDSGYYCVDNLPPELIKPFVALKDRLGARRLALAIDVRSGDALPQLPLLLHSLRGDGTELRLVFLEASDQALVRRFSESRRPHPLSRPGDAEARAGLMQAIARERALLGDLRERSHLIDTSQLRTAQLLDYVKTLIAAPAANLTLVFESFAFKRGITLDADFVFDVRMLPNPHYEPGLGALTGRDAPVAAFLEQHEEVGRMLAQIGSFLREWLPAMARDHRSYVTVAIGCTGGQHRSVYLAEQLAKAFDGQWHAITRHRELGPG